MRDTNGDDQFDKPEQLRAIDGGGEHGPHGVVLSPDGKSLYFVDGNHTKLPEHLEQTRAVAWGEDHLLPRMWDANGHAKGILAPGGAICKTDPDGKVVEMFASGFRNAYDIGFNAQGELFTYDSDMEWDIGSPWYRPTRIVHAVSGGEYGWRSGAGKWPEYYPDSLPPALNIGPGSPTGVAFGTGAKFPAKYQRAFFAADWTYGTMYAMHLVPNGASYRVEKEEFVAGKPLPLTDLLINPKDGAMYFLIGGRKTQSALYRVTYTGHESTAPATAQPETAEAKLRHSLEQLHLAGTGPEAIDKAWPYLGNARSLRALRRAGGDRASTRRKMGRPRARGERSPGQNRSTHRARPGRRQGSAAAPARPRSASWITRNSTPVCTCPCSARGSWPSPAWASPRRKSARRSRPSSIRSSRSPMRSKTANSCSCSSSLIPRASWPRPCRC